MLSFSEVVLTSIGARPLQLISYYLVTNLKSLLMWEILFCLTIILSQWSIRIIFTSFSNPFEIYPLLTVAFLNENIYRYSTIIICKIIIKSLCITWLGSRYIRLCHKLWAEKKSKEENQSNERESKRSANPDQTSSFIIDKVIR